MEIKKPLKNHLPQLEEFFKIVISDTVAREEIKILGFADEEVRIKMETFEKIFKNNNSSDISILIALDGEKIIGTISSSFCNQDIINIVGKYTEHAIQIGTLYIHPMHQKTGVAKSLLNSMYHILRSKSISEFYLDSGYKNAQKYWTKKFGDPLIIEKDCWGPEIDHMIWKVNL